MVNSPEPSESAEQPSHLPNVDDTPNPPPTDRMCHHCSSCCKDTHDATIPNTASPATVSSQHHQLQQLTGWEAVEKAIKDFDTGQVAMYRDDIDTLLVFDGLFSAAVTAFVIASYPLLQEDTTGAILVAVQQLVNQTAGYSVLGGTLVNTTAAPPAPTSPFKPTPGIVRVNTLWFSSLVVSLSAASLGIFVKQWLRAYLAFSTASPQGQLRAREFRHAGMEAWRVYGIAASLPLLIQAALGLFFTGLCYFTAEANESIGRTTFILVAAWGFMTSAILICPVFSSRCAYKTAAFEPITTVIRRRVFPKAYTVLKAAAALVLTALISFISPIVALLNFLCFSVILVSARLVVAIFDRLPPLPGRMRTANQAVRRIASRMEGTSVGRTVARSWRIVRTWGSIILVILGYIGQLWTTILDKDKNHKFSAWRDVTHIFPEWDPVEESAAIHDASKDLQILAAADAIQAHDQLLGTTMKAALEQSNARWQDVVEFLIGVIGNRIPLTATFAEIPTLVDLDALPGQTCNTFIEFFARHVVPFAEDISKELQGFHTNQHIPAWWALCLGVSLHRYDTSLSPFISQCLSEDTTVFTRLIRLDSHNTTGWEELILPYLSRALRETELSSELAPYLAMLHVAAIEYFGRQHIPGSIPKRGIILRTPRGEYLLDSAWQLVSSIILKVSHNDLTEEWPAWLDDAVLLFFRLYALTQIGGFESRRTSPNPTYLQITKRVEIAGPIALSTIVSHLVNLRSVESIDTHSFALVTLLDIVFVREWDATTQGELPALHELESRMRDPTGFMNFAIAVRNIVDIVKQPMPYELLKLCLIVIQLASYRRSWHLQRRHTWRFIFHILADVQLASSDRRVRSICTYRDFEPLSGLDHSPEDHYEDWCRTFNPTTSLVGDKFWVAVTQLFFNGTPSPNIMVHLPWRMRRIYGMSSSKRTRLMRQEMRVPNPVLTDWSPRGSRTDQNNISRDHDSAAGERGGSTGSFPSTRGDPSLARTELLASRSRGALSEESRHIGTEIEDDWTDVGSVYDYQPHTTARHLAVFAGDNPTVGRAGRYSEGVGSLADADSRNPSASGVRSPPTDEPVVEMTASDAGASANLNQSPQFANSDEDDTLLAVRWIAQDEAEASPHPPAFSSGADMVAEVGATLSTPAEHAVGLQVTTEPGVG